MSLLAVALSRDSLRRARTQGIIALALVLLGALALLLARWDLAEQRRLRTETEAQLGNLQAERDQLEETLGMLEGSLDRFRALQRGGFIGAGDRVAWTEALLRVRQRLDLPDTAFELSPQEVLEPTASDPSLAEAGLPEPAASGPLAHDLRIQISGIHEGEWLALIGMLRDEGIGFFRPQDCLLQREAQIDGLRVDCTLRWITYLPPSSSADGGEAGASE